MNIVLLVVALVIWVIPVIIGGICFLTDCSAKEYQRGRKLEENK